MSIDPKSEPVDVGALTAPGKLIEPYAVAYLEERGLPENLKEAVKYALLGPGKRLRPVLVIRSCEAVGGRAEQALAAATAIEMIHCFSLVHDDLPAMDNDDLRRGRPTLHRYTNEAMAILAGDLLNTMAFELLAARLEEGLARRVIGELARATDDMIAGQVYDTLGGFPEEMPAMERLRTIHRHKTGALIRCACRMGAMCGGANERQLAALTRYGEAVGLMFQVVDDLLDVTQTTGQLGKTAGKDAVQNKLTYPAVVGLEGTRAEIARLRDEAIAALEPLGPAGQRLRELCEYMAVRVK